MRAPWLGDSLPGVSTGPDPARALAKRQARRLLLDRLGRGLAGLGAVITVGAVALIAGFLMKEIVPLLQPARVERAGVISLPPGALVQDGSLAASGTVHAAGIDEFKERLFLLREDGVIQLLDARTGQLLEQVALAQRPEPVREGSGAAAPSVTAARYEPQRGTVALGFSDGRVGAARVAFPVAFEGQRRVVSFSIEEKENVQLLPEGQAPAAVDWVETRDRVVAVGAGADGGLYLLVRQAGRSLFGPAEWTERRYDLTGQLAGRPAALALSPDGNALVVGDDVGLLYQWDLAPSAGPRLVAAVVAAGPEAGRLVDLVAAERPADPRSAAQLVNPPGRLGDPAPRDPDDRARSLPGSRLAHPAHTDHSAHPAHAAHPADPALPAGPAVTALRFLIGGRSVVVGDAAGGVATWFAVPAEGRGQVLQPVHRHRSHNAPVTQIAASQRNRTFATADAAGVLMMHHSTSEQTFFALEAAGAPAELVIAPKSDGLLALSGEAVELWRVHLPHPEISLKTLFGRVHYEGYPEPQWMWQSTGGSNAFEPKFSLTPLIYGTLKGTVYALIFALPLGVLGAVYTSQFMTPRLQNVVKPAIEIMAGIPSVVLGFLGGLWLAPRVAQGFPALVLMAVFVPGSFIIAAWTWRRLTGGKRQLPAGAEVLLLAPVIGLSAWAALALGPWLEAAVMRGDFRFWVFDVFGLPYDQRNSLIVGIAMGFAVIPVVFSISEDALSSVPRDQIAGALALGATRWQTVRGVVIPAAMPGILSSVMMGVGRAVGETMIVLMATGNTPVMDFSIFNGFRALSANIAVEMPEAPVGGTLYRVLFVAALLLFAFTFLLNTLGEWIRATMQRRVQRL